MIVSAMRSATACCRSSLQRRARRFAAPISSAGWGARSLPSCCTGWRASALLAVAERIRNAFAAEAERIEGRKVGATVSIGLALHDGSAIAFTELLWKADRALYRAKESGRNRVEWAVPDFYSREQDGGVPLGTVLPATRNVA